MGLNGYTADGQDPKVVQRLLGKLRHFLTDNERIHYIAVQRKPQLNLFPDALVVTDQHLFLSEYTKMGLDLGVVVIPWNTMRSIQTERSADFATLTIIPQTDMDYIIDYVPWIQAEKLLKFARKQANINPPSVETESRPTDTAAGAIERGVEKTDEKTDENPGGTFVENPVVKKFESLYYRQRISKKEFETFAKKHNLEK